jgi:nucleoside-diphosphate-sugar epimerase
VVKRVVHCSSISVYGLPRNSTPVTESFSLAPLDWYGMTKALGEQLWGDFHTATSIPVVILRPSWVVGYGSRLLDKHLFRAFTSGIKIVMDLGTPCNVVYVRDVAEAAILAALDCKAGLRNYNINSLQRWSFDEFLQAINRAVSRPKLPIPIPKTLVKILSRRFGSLKMVLGDVFFDASRARDELGFVPQYDLAAMIKETLALSEGAKAGKGG